MIPSQNILEYKLLYSFDFCHENDKKIATSLFTINMVKEAYTKSNRSYYQNTNDIFNKCQMINKYNLKTTYI